MKSILTILFCLTILASSYGQQTEKPENDKRDYNLISSYDQSTKKWSKWKKTEEVFVLNYNHSGDIARFRPNKEMILYKKTSDVPIEKGKTSSGENYQIITAEEGFIKYEFQFFDNPGIGLELNVGTIKLRFSKN